MKKPEFVSNIYNYLSERFNVNATGNIFIKSANPGTGKSHLLATLTLMCKEEDSKKLCPTHKSKYNMKASKIFEVLSKNGQELKNLVINKYSDMIDNTNDDNELKKALSKNTYDVKVISSVLNTRDLTKTEILKSIRNVKIIFIDEVFQLNLKHINLLHEISSRYGIVLICAGDCNQAPSPDSRMIYDLKDNSFIMFEMFQTIITLSYIIGQGRFKDNLPLMLEDLRKDGVMPSYFNTKVASKNMIFDFYLTMTINKRNQMVRQRSQLECAKYETSIVKDGYGFCEGMPVIALENKTIDKFDYLNKKPVLKQSKWLIYQVFTNWKYYRQRMNKEYKYKGTRKQIRPLDMDELKTITIMKNGKPGKKFNQLATRNIDTFYKKHRTELNNLVCDIFNRWRRECTIKIDDDEYINLVPRHIKEKIYSSKFTVHNKEEFVIESVDTDNQTLTFTNGKALHIDTILKYFIPNYASTIDGYQGDRIDTKFCIMEVNHKHMNLERMNSAIGRSTCKDDVYLSQKRKDKFEVKKYPDNVMLDPKQKCEGELDMILYGVYFGDELVYIGTTSRTLEERKIEHLESDRNDKFHKALRDEVDVEFKVLEQKKFNNLLEAEDYEMEQVRKYNARLNTKRKTCRQELEKDNEPKEKYTMTMKEYNELKYYTDEIKVNISFTVLEKKQEIRYSYYHRGKKHNSSYISYKNKDIEEVKAKLTERFKVKCQEAGIKTVFD